MNDYETSYEEYKQVLLQKRWLRNELHEKYRGSLRIRKDYIDENGVLWKIGVLSGVCGFCLSWFWLLEDRGDTKSTITRIILITIIVAAFVFAMYIGSKFKKSLGDMVFYSFQYHKYFEDHVQKEKDRETNLLMRDIWEEYKSLLCCSDSFPNMTKESLESILFKYFKKMDDYQKRYFELKKFDLFASDLKNDYYFNAEVQKNIDKYI